MNQLKKLFNLTYYKSELDQFLEAFDAKHPKLSNSQEAEQKKYKRIFQLRDNAVFIDQPKKFWDEF